jgi:hypothetical protein
MFKKVAGWLLVSVASMVFSGFAFAADDPSMHEIYQAAQAGNMTQAQAMMDKVLHDHPNSAKAHFVSAELQAKQGHLSNAQTELNTAERIAPGLPFAKPQAVQQLKNKISPSQPSTFYPTAGTSHNNASPGLPWGMILLGLGVLGMFIYFMRAVSRNNAQPVMTNSPSGYAQGAPLQGFGNGGGMPQYGPTGGAVGSGPGSGPGIGSGIMGGLATGAAVGAGIVAGEALMHHFTDGTRRQEPLIDNSNSNVAPASYDMGGNDFGVNDSSSWDDNSAGGGGGDDWS